MSEPALRPTDDALACTDAVRADAPAGRADAPAGRDDAPAGRDPADPPAPLTIAEAEALLDGLDLVPAMGGKLDDIKQVRARCLAAGIPAIMGCPGKPGGCGPNTHLLVDQTDLPAIADLLSTAWTASLAREGLAPATRDATACPACGATADLTPSGECPDCGLQLT